MTEAAGAAAVEKSWAVLRIRDLQYFCAARISATSASNMLNVAVGLYVYDLTRSAWSLGLAGLFTFLPVAMLALVTGQVADLYDRRRVAACSYAITALVAAGLVVCTYVEIASVWPVYVLAGLVGAARSFANPAAKALMPNLVPRTHLPQAMAWTGSFETFSQVAGPAIGGLLYLLGARVAFVTPALLFAIAALAMLAIRARPEQARREKPTWRTVSAGARFIASQKILLGAMTLDMVAVCLGGVTALLPIFAEIYGAGAWGAGLLRSAPAVGALFMASALAVMPLRRNCGKKLLWSVAAYGAAIVAFGLATNIYVAALALLASGAADQISVFIRQTIMQADTPDEMRGRVSSFSVIFIGATTSLGEFESGALAALVGAVPAVVIGGCGAILCAGLWGWLFPALRRRDQLVPSKPGG